MKEYHIHTLSKLLEILKETGHNLVHEVEEIPSLKAFWDTMYDEIPDLVSNLEEILAEAKDVAIEVGEEVASEAGEIALEVGEAGEIIAEDAGDVILEAEEFL